MVTGLSRGRGYAFLLFIGLTILLGQGCWGGFRNSGIPQTLKDGPLLKSTVALQEGEIFLASSTWSSDPDSAEWAGEYLVTPGAGRQGLLMSRFQEQVEKLIENSGGKIHGRGMSGKPGDVKDFELTYKWERNKGLMRVNSVATTNGITVLVFCYEHRR